MAKATGLGDYLYIGGYAIGGDTQALSKISGSLKTLDLTDITQSAYFRLGGQRDGEIHFTVFHDIAAGAAHPALSPQLSADTIVSYLHGATIGNPAACMTAKQVTYDPTRAADGSLTFDVQTLANGFGLEWGEQLTAGLRTDTAATDGTSWDGAAATTFGLQAYLQVTAFTGTDVTIKLEDSANNSSFADLTGGGFTQVTAAPAFGRIATTNAATVRRYVRVSTVTSGGFTSVSFIVVMVRNAIAGQVF